MDDWTALIKNAVAAIVIITTIAVIVFLAFLGMNSANRSGDKLAETVTVLDARAMETYEQKVVNGTTVLTAIKMYQKRNLAVIVRTNSATVNYNALLGTK